MSKELEPVVDNWYRSTEKGQMFKVISIDDERDAIEVQHFDGDLEELDQTAWRDMELEPANEPEDWTGPFDDVEKDDLGYEETDTSNRDWDALLTENRLPDEDRDEEEEDRDEEGPEPPPR